MGIDAADPQSKVKQEVRALLHLLVKQHVKSWFTGFSQDQQLFQELDAISSHIQTTLSARIGVVDWDNYLLHILPELVLLHLQDLNLAFDRSRFDLSVDQAFLRLQSHPGISDQESYLLHISEALLVVLLPENDLMSDVAYTFARELVSDLVLRALIDRLSEPWFWHETILRLTISATSILKREAQNISARAASILASIKRSIRMCLPKRTTENWSKARPSLPPKDSREYSSILRSLRHPIEAYQSFNAHLQASESFYDTAFPEILTEIMRPSTWPMTKLMINAMILPLSDILVGHEIMNRASKNIDCAISQNSLAQIVHLARNVLFPDDEPSPARIVPTKEQQAALQAELQSMLPVGIAVPFFDHKCINKVLLFKILDSLLGTIFPELQKRSPAQLKEKLIHIRQANFEAEGAAGLRSGSSRSRTSSIHSPMSLSVLSTF